MLYGNVINGIDAKIPDRLSGGFRPTTLKQPLFPLFLAAIFYLFGSGNFLAVFVVHSILAGLTAIILYMALQPEHEQLGAFFALGYAVYPPFVFQCATSPESTILLLFLLATFFLLGSHALRRRSMLTACGLGGVAGLLVMTNFGAVAFTLPALCFVCLSRRFSTSIKQMAVAALFLGIVTTPWLVRNYITFGRFTMRASTGHELLKARVEAGLGLAVPEELLLNLERRGRSLNEIEEGQLLDQEIRSRIGWQARISTILLNLKHFWWEPPRYTQDYSMSYLLGRRIPYYILLALCVPALAGRIFGAIRTGINVGKQNIEVIASLLLLADTLVYGYWGGWNIRYHFPSELALMLFAAQSAMGLYHRLKTIPALSRRLAPNEFV